MGIWEGNIIIDNKEIKVYVNYTKPSTQSYGEWSGYGYADEFLNLDTYETDIGTIVINHISIESEKTYFTFLGSGMPKGELAKEII